WAYPRSLLLLARDLPPGTQLQETVAALAEFRRGQPDAGLESLRRISSQAPIFAWRISPLFLLGERLVDAGHGAEAIDVLRHAQALYVPVAMWRSWAYPRSLLLLARACQRTGRVDEARQSLERLLSDWKDAEPDAALLKEALELRAKLPAR
ncbi:MAG TPA: tetratricopeptide repeat protein, partial [Myxococcaceae bacterium]|nr:tetratricopeptide repeat protein [Myxococcaceae bacterium]